MSQGEKNHDMLSTDEIGNELLCRSQQFTSYGFKVLQHQRATDFFLFRPDGTGLRISSRMIELSDRLEVGVLCVDEIDQGYLPDLKLQLPVEFTGHFNAERLVLENEHGKFESGISLSTKRGDELIIIPGAYPYTLEVRMTLVLMGPERFDPEYPLNEYRRVKL